MSLECHSHQEHRIGGSRHCWNWTHLNLTVEATWCYAREASYLAYSNGAFEVSYLLSSVDNKEGVCMIDHKLITAIKRHLWTEKRTSEHSNISWRRCCSRCFLRPSGLTQCCRNRLEIRSLIVRIMRIQDRLRYRITVIRALSDTRESAQFNAVYKSI